MAFRIGLIFTVSWIVLAIPTGILLLRAYARTSISGFLWFTAALVGWPLLGRSATIYAGMLGSSTSMVVAGASMGTLLLLQLVESVVGGLLVIVAVVVLEREVSRRLGAAGAMAPPPPPPPYQGTV